MASSNLKALIIILISLLLGHYLGLMCLTICWCKLKRNSASKTKKVTNELPISVNKKSPQDMELWCLGIDPWPLTMMRPSETQEPVRYPTNWRRKLHSKRFSRNSAKLDTGPPLPPRPKKQTEDPDHVQDLEKCHIKPERESSSSSLYAYSTPFSPTPMPLGTEIVDDASYHGLPEPPIPPPPPPRESTVTDLEAGYTIAEPPSSNLEVPMPCPAPNCYIPGRPRNSVLSMLSSRSRDVPLVRCPSSSGSLPVTLKEHIKLGNFNHYEQYSDFWSHSTQNQRLSSIG